MRILFVILLAFFVSLSDAQNPAGQTSGRNLDTVRNTCLSGDYLLFGLGAGLHSLAYGMDHGENYRNSRAGFGWDMGYQHFFSPHWGISAGLASRFYTTKSEFNYQYSAFDTDTDIEDYEHITIFKEFNERQTMMNLGVPVMGVYQRELGRNWRWTAAAGIKLSGQVYSKSKRISGEIETQGYFDQYHLLLYGMQNHWFMLYDKMQARFKSNIQASAVTETNFNYVLKRNPRLELTFGLYGEYNFNNTHKVDNLLHFDYSTDTYNGALNTAEVNKVHPFAVGGRLGLRYRLVKKTKTKIPDDPIEPGKPGEPNEPDIPNDSIPERPTIPDIPEDPIIPDIPNDSVPNVPDIPDIPNDSVPGKPDVPAIKKHLNINYDFDKTANKFTGHEDLLDDIAELLKSEPERKILIVGHTDNYGSYQYNYQLGLRRAKAVRAELLRRGVAGEQIEIQSKSFSEPLVPNNTKANRAINRRAELIY